MKHKLTYLILLLCCGGLLYGQTYFNNLYPGTCFMKDFVELDSGYATFEEVCFKPGFFIREYDLSGKVIDSVFHNLSSDSQEEPVEVIRNPNSKSTFYIGSKDSVTGLLKLNQNWDIEVSLSYQFPNHKTIISNAKWDSDTSFITTGRIERDSVQSILLAKFDKDLNLLWEKKVVDTIGNSIRFEGLEILPDSQGGYFIGAHYWDLSGLTSTAIILKTDSIGNLIWRKTISNKKSFVTLLLSTRSDGNLVAVWTDFTTNSSSFHLPSIVNYEVFNSLGQSVLKKALLNQPFKTIMNKLEVDKNGNFFAIGFISDTISGSPYKINRSTILKFDEQGNNIWVRKYYPESSLSLSVFSDLAFTNDSGMIVSGRYLESWDNSGITYVQNRTWLLKLDQYGCDTAGCEQVSLPEVNLPQTRLEVYPNPVNNHVQLHWAEQQDEVSIKIYNSTGQLIDHRIFKNIQDAEITTRSWPAGIYHLKLISKGKEQALTLVKR